MALQTYRDSKTGRIFTETGEQIKDLSDYQAKVRAGTLSGTPLDISKMPSINRDLETGDILQKSNLDQMVNKNKLLDLTKQIIQRKQKFNEDIQSARGYWRGLINDTGAFGAAREPALTMPGMFTDESLRQLSPEDQASVRATRYSVAQANLSGLKEEEQYRETQTKDIIKSLEDMYSERDKLAKTEQDKIDNALINLKRKDDLGIPLTDDDYKGAGVDVTSGKTGGTISWRHNNPLNIKYGTFAKGYGATEGQSATDGGKFAIFPDVEAGLQAAKDLLKSKSYKDLPLNSALKRWSGNGYGVDKLMAIAKQSLPWMTKTTGQMSSNELDQLTKLMQVQEGWQEGTILNQPKSVTLTTAQKAKIMQDYGLTNDMPEVKSMTEDDWIIFGQAMRSKAFEKGLADAQRMLKEGGIMSNAITIKNKLASDYQELSSSDIETILAQIGFEIKAGSILGNTYNTPLPNP